MAGQSGFLVMCRLHQYYRHQAARQCGALTVAWAKFFCQHAREVAGLAVGWPGLELYSTLRISQGTVPVGPTRPAVQVVGEDAKGHVLTFKHPAVQTAFMFLGEALCLIPFLIRRWWVRRSGRDDDLSEEEKVRGAATSSTHAEVM
jgi:hypothetical protein